MPLTNLQQTILALLAQSRAPDSYLAGGAALHFTTNSVRYSNDPLWVGSYCTTWTSRSTRPSPWWEGKSPATSSIFYSLTSEYSR